MVEKQKSRSIFRAMISVSGVVVIAKLFGLVRQIVTANAFGANSHTDLIVLAEELVGNLNYLIVQTLTTAFIPTYLYAKAKNIDESNKFASNSIMVFFLVSSAITALFFACSSFISRIIAPSYSTELSQRLAEYIRIVSPIIIVVVLQAIFNAILRSNERFVAAELIGFNQSIIVIVLVLLFGQKKGPDTLIVCLFIYEFFNLFFLMFNSRSHWTFVRSNPFKDSNVKKLLIMMGPLILGYSMVFVNQLIDKIIVSGLGSGILTSMGYAAVLSNFIGTFIGSICGVLFTYISQSIADNKDEEAAGLVSKSSLQMITLFLPISILTVINSRDITQVVFGHGQFDEVAVRNCSIALAGYGFMFVPLIVRELFSRFQYAYGDSKHPMINSTIGIAFNIIFSILLSRFIGVLGVTIATSISVVVCAFLNVWSAKKKSIYLNLSGTKGYLLRWILGTTICIVVSLIGKSILVDLGSFLRLVIIVLVAFLGYSLVSFSTIKELMVGLKKNQ